MLGSSSASRVRLLASGPRMLMLLRQGTASTLATKANANANANSNGPGDGNGHGDGESSSSSSSSSQGWDAFLKGSKAKYGAFFQREKSRASDSHKKAAKPGGPDGPNAGEGSSSSMKGKSPLDMVKHLGCLMREELQDIFDMKPATSSATRRRETRDGAQQDPQAYMGSTEVATLDGDSPSRSRSEWQRKWDSLKDQAQSHAFFQKVLGLKDHAVVKKANDLAEDLRDRWETSDSPLVHRIQDNLVHENAFAGAMREIRARDPGFDMVAFLRDVRGDVRPVMAAYLEGNLAVLAEHCSKEVCERVAAQKKFLEAEGAFLDTQILDIKEIQLFDVKSFEGSPLVIVRFALQQVKCVRDKFGNILEGAPDEINAVDYLWALQQDPHGTYAEGGYLPPRWVLREVQGIQEMRQIV